MAEKKKDVLQPVDDQARRLAKTLVRSSRYATLATLEALDGYPAASRVSLATTMGGNPVFLISRLSGHFGNLTAEPRCSLLVGEVGKGDPFAHPRMTLIGRAERMPDGEARDLAKARFLKRHPKSVLYADFPDFAFWRFATVRASLNAGFGKAYALQPADLETRMTEALAALEAAEAGAVAHMNEGHADAVEHYASLLGEDAGRWRLACLDPEGLDLTCGDAVTRLWFDRPLSSAADLRPTLLALAKR